MNGHRENVDQYQDDEQGCPDFRAALHSLKQANVTALQLVQSGME